MEDGHVGEELYIVKSSVVWPGKPYLWPEIFFLPYVVQQGNYIQSTQLPRPLHPQSCCSALRVTLDFLAVLHITKLIFFSFKVGKLFCFVENKTKAKHGQLPPDPMEQ